MPEETGESVDRGASAEVLEDRSAGGTLVVSVMARGGQSMRAFRFRPGDRLSFGREQADVILDDSTCSRVHFEIANVGGKCTLRDLNSSNGTRLNGECVGEALVKVGDHILAGLTVVTVGGNLNGPSLQVVVEITGLDEPLPELKDLGEKAKGKDPTLEFGPADVASSQHEPRTAPQLSAPLPGLPGVWQACEALFDDLEGPPRLSRLVDAIRTLGSAQRVELVSLPKEGEAVVTLASSEAPSPEPRLPILPELVSGCSSLGATVSIPAVSADPRYRKVLSHGPTPDAGVVYAAVSSLRKTFGVLYVEWRNEVDLPQKLTWAWFVASLAGLLIDRNDLEADLRKANERLEEKVAERTKELATAVQRLIVTQRAMEQAGKLATVGELSAGFVHELSNPLTSIMLHSQLQMMEGVPHNRDYSRTVVLEQAMRAHRIVKNILSFARRQEPRPKPTSISEVLDRSLALVEHETKQLQLELKKDLSKDLPAALCDGTQLEHVFINLIVNACHASQTRGMISISIRARVEGDHLRIEFADDGPGIPPEILAQIFDPFFTTKPVGHGTGLGLFTSKTIIESQGGSLTAANGEAGGAVFAITLPPASASETVAVLKESAETADLAVKIMVVDDEPEICRFAARFLELSGCSAVVAESMKEALALMEKESCDVLVTDYHMPGGNGLELFYAAKGLGNDFTGRVIVISGTVDEDDLRDALKDSDAKFLPKPFTPSSLLSSIRAIQRERKYKRRST